jgi:ABC-2 type transport system ATP-binding protein
VEHRAPVGVGIRARGLHKRFGDVDALRDVDLDVAPGEIVTILGPNGAGKSTLLRILATTVLPDAGTVHIAGHDAVADPHAVRRVQGVSLGDERSWYFRLSGRENLEFFAVLNGMRRRDARSRAAVLLAEVDLAGVADRRFDGYSSGMRARLSLARALLVSPAVLLLDEPTRTLDPIAALAFREQMRDLAGRQGRTVLFATHDLHEAAAVSDRVVVLVGGRLTPVSEPEPDAATLERVLIKAAGG